MHREAFRQAVLDDQPDAIAFVHLNRRAGHAAVEAPRVDDAGPGRNSVRTCSAAMSKTLTPSSSRQGMSGTSGVITGTTPGPSLSGGTGGAGGAGRVASFAAGGWCTCCARRGLRRCRAGDRRQAAKKVSAFRVHEPHPPRQPLCLCSAACGCRLRGCCRTDLDRLRFGLPLGDFNRRRGRRPSDP